MELTCFRLENIRTVTVTLGRVRWLVRALKFTYSTEGLLISEGVQMNNSVAGESCLSGSRGPAVYLPREEWCEGVGQG